MKKLRRTFLVLLFILFLSSCNNTEQCTEKVAALENEKTMLESKIKELESSQQQAISLKDNEIARLKELNKSLETQATNLQKQSNLQSSDDYVGHWISKNVELWIVKDGDNYLITSHNPGGAANGKFVGRYEDGRVKLTTPLFGDITYSKQSGKIYWIGEEFTKN